MNRLAGPLAFALISAIFIFLLNLSFKGDVLFCVAMFLAFMIGLFEGKYGD